MWKIFSQSKGIQKQLDTRWHRLYRLAYSWSHDSHLAKDLAQETLIKALKSKHQLKDEKALDAWLFTILNNCWRDHWRSKKEMLDIDSMVLSVEDDHYAALERQEIVTEVRHAISLLPLNQRQVITLIDLEEMGYKEVAIILDIPIGTVMSRLNRARKSLKIKLLDIEKNAGQKKPNLRSIK